MATPTLGYFPVTGDLLMDSLTTGYFWQLKSDRTIDWSISNGWSGEYWNSPANLQSNLATIFALISYYTDVRFNYVGYFQNPAYAASSGSELNISLDASGGLFPGPAAWAIGFFPNSSYNQIYTGAPGDVYLNVLSPANFLPGYEIGTSGFALFIHEIGHALGLKHTHDDGGTGRPTFTELGLADLDIDWASVMSYRDDFSWNFLAFEPATPMLLDVLALQYLYGRNMTTNSGDTVFAVSVTNGYATAWDSGGFDTVDASTSTTGMVILLPFAQLSELIPSKVGFSMRVDEVGSTPTTLLWLTGDMEAAVGSPRADLIGGNSFQNNLLGQGGDDFLDGAEGIDFAFYSGMRSEYNATPGTQGFVVEGATDGRDLLVNVERLVFSDVNVAIDMVGNAGTAVKMMGALLGAGSIQNEAITGLVLDHLDGGMSAAALADFGLSAVLGDARTNENVFSLLFINLAGTAAPAAIANEYIAMLQSGRLSQVELVLFAAEHPLNLANIGFQELTQIEYL